MAQNHPSGTGTLSRHGDLQLHYRPNYYLADGHYVGCEPTETLRQTMKLRSARKLIREL